VRRLAAAANVAGSTITRIQSGAVDPSVRTLERILDAAGFDLRIEAVRRGGERHPRLADLADAWTLHDGRLRLDWTRWRALIDELALRPELTPEAIYVAPPVTGEDVVDSLMAAVAEKLADDAGLPRPLWASLAPSLAEPYRPPVARALTGRSIPAQLAARGLMIDAESLWRDRDTVGA
jgi:transcriptional regulator with XRE-family HTH domain